MKIKMPSSFTILFWIIIVVSILTWIIPSGKYIDNVYQTIPSNPQGIWDILAAPAQGFLDAIDVILYCLVIGGFLRIVLKSGAIDAMIGATLTKLKGKEFILIPTLFILFSIGGSAYGLGEETLAFYPFLLPIFIRAGYDPMTVILVTLVGSNVGIVGAIINPFSVGIASSQANVPIGEGLFTRLVIYVVCVTIALVYTMIYASKVKKNYSHSIVSDMKSEHLKSFTSKDLETPPFTKRRKIIIFLYLSTFFTLILGVIPWASKFNILIFKDVYNYFAQFSILGLDSTESSLYGSSSTSSVALGDWWFGQIAVLFFASSVVVGLIAKMKESEIVENFIEGSKDLLGVALVIGLSRGIKVILENGAINDTILHTGELMLRTLGEVGFINLTYLLYLPLGLLIPSTSGLATATIPILGPLGEIMGVGAASVVTAYQASQGIVNFIAPTSGIVVGSLMLSKVPYGRFLKFMIPLLLILTIVTMTIISIDVYLN